MAGTASYFFDTYAIIELVKGNPAYTPYKNTGIVVSTLNLFECHFHVARKFGRPVADSILEELSKCVISFTNDDIRTVTEFRSLNRRKKFSFPDSLGYVLAMKQKLRFLTGDERFRDLPNVEFVK
jgi:uncharacterized protein